jgi:hypothetical protein
LPFTVKGTEERIRKRVENGLRVKGTGIGQRVKGKESERTMKARLNKRKKAMLEMPQMIQTWKEVKSLVLSLIHMLTTSTERTWSLLEEMAEIDQSVRGCRDFFARWQYLYKRHIGRVLDGASELKCGVTMAMYNKSAI